MSHTAEILVQATVSQQQPTYLAKLLGLSTVNIGAQAVAQVNSLAKPPCVLALTGSFSFQGSANINAPGCDIASNGTATDALNFTGGGMSLALLRPSLSAAGGCSGAAMFCGSALTYRPPATNPFSALDSALTTLCGANPSLPAHLRSLNYRCLQTRIDPVAYTAATPCTNNGITTKGNTAVTLASRGVLHIRYSDPHRRLLDHGYRRDLHSAARGDNRHQGGRDAHAHGADNRPELPRRFPRPFSPTPVYLRAWPFTMPRATAVQFGGNSNINITGNIYAPTAAVTFQGNPTTQSWSGNNCGELIAASIAFNGNATFDDSGCAAAGVPVPSANMCSWCNDEKARSARRRGAGILPCRRAAFHIDVRHLRSGTLCNHDAVLADARECGCSGNDDPLLHTRRNSKYITLWLYR